MRCSGPGSDGFTGPAPFADARVHLQRSDDPDVWLTAVCQAQGVTTAFSWPRIYHAVDNVTRVNTTLAAGDDNHAFCYDEQNQLIWPSRPAGRSRALAR